MASKQHCDRCDRVITGNSYPRQTDELPGSFLTDHGIGDACYPIRVSAELTTFDGECWNRVELCLECFEQAMDTFAKQRREFAEAR